MTDEKKPAKKPEKSNKPEKDLEPLTVSEVQLTRNLVQKYGMLQRSDANTVVKLSDLKTLRSIHDEKDCEKCAEKVRAAIPENLRPQEKTESKLTKKR